MTPPNIAPPLAGNILGAPSNNFLIAEWREAGNPDGARRLVAPPHVHHSDDEAWYILEGTLRVQAGPDEVEARAGSGVLVKRGTPHTYWNPLPEPARYLLIMTPNIYRLIQAIHAMPDRNGAALEAVFRQHDSDLVDEKAFT